MTQPMEPTASSERWHLGPPTLAYKLYPPGGKVITHEGLDQQTGKPVEIVLLRQPWSGKASVRKAYRYGIEQLLRLDHPNIVRPLGFIDTPDQFGMVTDCLHSDNLHRHLRFGQLLLTETEVVELITRVAEALRHAHERGVVFGNLKPTNLEMLPDGSVKVAALPKPPQQAFTSVLDAADYLGYPVYNSPEMLRAEPLDCRSDIYGLGICAYELIVSRLPHQHSDNLGTEMHLLCDREWPPPTELVEGLPPRLNQVVTRCLRKTPAERFQTADEVIRELQTIRGRPVRLLSSARLQEIVTSVFPGPLAALAHSLERDDHLLAQKDKLLSLTAGLITYLGSLAFASLGQPLPHEFARPALGHWVGLLRRTLSGGAAAPPMDLWNNFLAQREELLTTLDEAVALRNEIAHPAPPPEGPVLHGWVGRMTSCVRQLFRALLPLAHRSLVVVEDLDYRDNRFVVAMRRLNGIGELEALVRVTSEQPYTRDRVYLATGDLQRLWSLHPWVTWVRCPLCYQHELFFFNAVKNDKAHYVTPDRGHAWACPVPADLLQMTGGKPIA
jgi:hypothetical protein